MRTMRWESVSDRNGEKGGRKNQQGVLDEIEEEIGTERYKEIIGALMSEEYESLSDSDKALIERIKREKRSVTH